MGTPAWAHDDLTASQPKSGATLQTAPKEITLTFAEPVNARFVKVGVARDGKNMPVAKPAVTGAVVHQVLDGAAPGAYAVSYRIVSTDGHPVTGSLRFTLSAPKTTGGAGAPAAASSTPAAAPSAPPSVQIGSATLTPTADNRGRTRVLLFGTVAILCLLGVAAAGLHLVSVVNRRPKRREPS
jgi:methionine-rich copper-binding protein CopC